MIKQADRVSIQKGVPFSQSKIWSAQREYYHNQGIEAWADQVPFYVTSNPVIADHYAKIMVRFFQDYMAQQTSTEKQTFYIVELGSGTGQFSYYVIRRMLDMMALWGIDNLSFCYVITDFTQNNLDHWAQHPCLVPLIEQGIVDFATFDLENDTYIKLQHSHVTLSEGSVTTPITVIANYLFDSVVMDVFRVQENEIQESKVDISAESRFVSEGGIDWPKVDFEYHHSAIAENYYQHPVFDEILKLYASQLKDSYVQFPIGGLKGLDSLSALSNGRLLLLSSDKGYVSIDELDNLEQPTLAFHGSFSTMVNFHAIAEYFTLQGGSVCLQEEYDAFATGAFALGFDMAALPRMNAAIQQSIGGFSPGHFFHLYTHFEKTVNQASLESILSMLNFAFWDPDIFELASDRISDLLDDADVDVAAYLLRKLPLIAKQFYFVPGCEDVLFDVAVLFQEMEEYESALDYFVCSLQYFSAGYEVHFNMGYCYQELGCYSEALLSFKQAEQFQPKSKELKQYLVRVEKQLNTD